MLEGFGNATRGEGDLIHSNLRPWIETAIVPNNVGNIEWEMFKNRRHILLRIIM